MLRTPVSYYPEKIDEMTFFQDNDIEKMETIHTYNNLISQGCYNAANDFISKQNGIYGFFADFLNLIENRIYNLQAFLLQKPPKKQPFATFDEEEELPAIDEDTIWI